MLFHVDINAVEHVINASKEPCIPLVKTNAKDFIFVDILARKIAMSLVEFV